MIYRMLRQQYKKTGRPIYRTSVTKLQFTFLFVRLETDAAADLTPGTWSHVRLKRSKKSRRRRGSK
ncbi:hypothetical protein J6590_099112 [Homalodisca vitripennis]|nr:hypothetical protein J6590_099112 [Homalodisca vitripennis]